MKISSLATVALAVAAAAPTAARRQTRGTKPTRSLEDIEGELLEDKKGNDNKKICEASSFEGTFQYSAPSSGLIYTVIYTCQDDDDYGKKCVRAEQADGDDCAYYSFFTESDVVYDKDKKMCGLGPTRTGSGNISWPTWFNPLSMTMPGSADPNPWDEPLYVTNVSGGGFIPSVTNADCTYADGMTGLWGFKEWISDSANQLETYFTANGGASFSGFGPAGAEVPRWGRRVGPQ
jgi:hypothetical protein